MRKKAALIFVLCFLAGFTGLYAGQYDKQIRAFEDFVKKQMKVDRIPGLSVAFMKGDFIWARGFGYADLENKTPATAESSYRLASITKTMTAVAILQLMEKGKLKLDDEVQKYVPYFPRKRWPVTVRYLLGHLAGISHYRSYEELHIKTHKDTREALAIFSGFELISKPGTEFHYSSYGYNLLGAVIEGAARMPYGKYMRRNIWGPLNMKNTCMDSPDDIIPHRVRGYRIVEGKLKNSEFIDMSSRFAAGGTRSTVLDLLKFIRGIKEGKLLKPETVDIMWTPMATTKGYYTDYGMGWSLRPRDGHFLVYHSGAQAETRTLLVYLPRQDLIVSFGCNLEGANPYLYGFRLVQLLLDEPWELGAYTGNEGFTLLYSALSDTFNYGLSYFEKRGRALTDKKTELEKAFQYFNESMDLSRLKENWKAFKKRINNGRHPVSGQAFVKVGSFMAEVLYKRYGKDRLMYYHRNGALPFFEDYIKLCRTRPENCRGFMVSNGITSQILSWAQDWHHTLNDYTRTLFIGAYSDFPEIKRELKKLFKGRKIYPDFTGQIMKAAEKLYISGNRKAFDAAALGLEIYPDSGRALVALANTYVANGDTDKAMEFYRKAMKARVHRDAASADALFSYMLDFYDAGQLDRALSLAMIAKKLYPDDPRFLRGIADVYLKRAKILYKRSLELDPNYEYSWKMLKKLKTKEW